MLPYFALRLLRDVRQSDAWLDDAADLARAFAQVLAGEHGRRAFLQLLSYICRVGDELHAQTVVRYSSRSHRRPRHS